MAKNLVIVESPAKAKTIEGYLGKDFLVKSSFGHIRDLPKKSLAVDVERGFEPKYEILSDKKDLVKELKKLVDQTENVWLATDDDREGEAISWHLAEALGLPANRTKRIVFREITKKAILAAIETPRMLNLDLVNSQQARRILDRIVGYELSPVLWKKIQRGLSAGRVQSVAVRIVVEREREIESFNTSSAFKIVAEFKLKGGKKLIAELKDRFNTEDEARLFLENCLNAQYKIRSLITKPGKRSPAPPFTTSTLQQEAARKLNFSVSQTMLLAQKLYEAGKISYMRTDSFNLSDDAIEGAKNQIIAEYGTDFSNPKKYKTKNESAQEAHEAIRPTDFAVKAVGGERNEQRLYELIWKRAIASQMADAKIEKTTADIEILIDNKPLIFNKREQLLTASGEVVTFEGFLKVYEESTDDEDEGESKMLPPLNEGQILDAEKLSATQRFARPPARYTEASLVKKLEEIGVGRPSTYAPTISTIIKREYVVKESREGTTRDYRQLVLAGSTIEAVTKTENTGAEKNKLFPTSTGVVVNDFLVDMFPSIVDFAFTATIEKELDEVAGGKQNWEKMLSNFYNDFHNKISTIEQISRQDFNQARKLGIDPVSGKEVFARIGKYGPYAQIGENDDKEKKYASLKKDQRIDTITLDEALGLFALPRDLGIFEGKPMQANIGRFGPYVKHNSAFISIPKDLDPYSITEDQAIELILDKRKKDSEKLIKEFEENKDLKILNGRWGPYIAHGKTNVKIPKAQHENASNLSLDEVMALVEAQGTTPARRPPPRKKK